MNPTIAFTGTGDISIAYDYSIFLERIATSLETIATATVSISNSLSTLEGLVTATVSISNSLSTLEGLATSTGIRTESPYDWIMPTEVYSWYNQDLDLFTLSTSSVERLTAVISTVTNYMPKFQ